MHVIEVTNPVEMRKAKSALYGGAHKIIMLNGQTVSGWVRSVAEDASVIPTKWTVSITPTPITQLIQPAKSKQGRWR